MKLEIISSSNCEDSTKYEYMEAIRAASDNYCNNANKSNWTAHVLIGKSVTAKQEGSSFESPVARGLSE